jgi:hypothetical protein
MVLGSMNKLYAGMYREKEVENAKQRLGERKTLCAEHARARAHNEFGTTLFPAALLGQAFLTKPHNARDARTGR